VVGIVLATGGCGGARAGRNGEGKFHSTAYGYSLRLPRHWTVVSASRTLNAQQAPVTGLPVTDIFAPHASRHIRQLTLPALVVGGQRVRPDETLQAWTNEVIALVGRFKGCPTPAAQAHTAIGGRDAVVLTYPNC